nr:biotin transporter BioY [Gardnerella vaginalis]
MIQQRKTIRKKDIVANFESNSDANSSANSSAVASKAFGVNRLAVPFAKAFLFTVLISAATMAGALPIPGTPVPVTLQTLVLALAGLTLTWRQAVSSVLMYLAIGAAGMPVFAGGKSGVVAFAGPSVGFLVGFVFGVAVIALVKSALEGVVNAAMPEDSVAKKFARFGAYFAASVVGSLVIYAFGFVGQSLMMHLPVLAIAVASTGFIVGDIIKAAIASAACAGLYGAFKRNHNA